jgi:transposase InsO family protein
MESPFHTQTVGRVPHRIDDTPAAVRHGLFGWIEGWYKCHRLHSALGDRSPAVAERRRA